MTLLHLSVRKGCGLTHDEADAPSILIDLEICGLVLEWWIGVRR